MASNSWFKKLGCHWFDIGGLTKGTPLGVAKFKKGLNSKYYTLLGEWLFFQNFDCLP